MSGGDYAGYIWSAYAVAALAVAGLVLRTVVDARIQAAALARLGRDAEGGSDVHD